MTNPEIEKLAQREATAEKPPETPERERLPDISKIQREIDTETDAGLKAGHDTLSALQSKEQTSAEFPPELNAQFAEIQKETADKLRRLDLSLGRMKERFLSVANFLTGGLFERGRNKPKEKNKFFTGFYVGEKQLGIGSKERSRLESQVDMGQVRERAKNAGEYLSDKIRGNDVVLLGEIHTHETVEKRATARFLEQAKAAGTTHIGLEIPAYYQEAVDHYMTTGKFDDADDPTDYERVDEYHQLFREQLTAGVDPKNQPLFDFQRDEGGQYRAIKREGVTDEMFAFEQQKMFKKNFLFKNHLDKNYRLLEAIRQSGLRPSCIDANATYGTNQELDRGMESLGRNGVTMETLKAKEAELEKQRDIFMMQKIREVVEGGGKMLAILGNAHVARDSMEGRQNVADLLDETDIRASSINLDRECDSDAELSFFRREEKVPDTSANSVLFSAIGKDEGLADRSIGFDLDQGITGEKAPAPYDGYIRLGGAL
ncbi:ChaN family lipoprotein [Candidatus Kuenenbacteria bacterium]|nr:ChaN family lipoprotein [Candidatus Kuenenbacteria bacterium]